MKVLIIEDNHIWGFKLQILAERCGLDVMSIKQTLVDANEFLLTSMPDLIIADVMLGEDIIFDLYKDSKIKQIPTIFVTASEQEILFKKASQIENASFLVKPFHQFSLQAAINLITKKEGININERQNEHQIIRNHFKEMFRLLDDTKLLDKFNIGEREKDVVVQRLKNNKSFNEIADEKGFSRENARKLFYRGLKKLIAKINNAQSRYSHFLEFTMHKQNKLEINKTLANKNLGISNNTINKEDYLKQSIDELQLLGTKWKNILHEKHIHTIEDLMHLNKKQLSLMPKFGPFAVSTIELELSENGLKLKNM